MKLAYNPAGTNIYVGPLNRGRPVASGDENVIKSHASAIG
jgi:hypothetical protein